ncbi:hypothetical protein LCGC14_0310470 [marine sediment metagenome]|uniref:Recombination endonuclease VII n=1 Tax=marine sediment metagenome TaxID=412755 RepID=A0A0F9TSA8_9ZZZZ
MDDNDIERVPVRKLSERDYRLYVQYGIVEGEYEDLLVEQEGGCAICHVTPFPDERKLGVDHNHRTGKVRGLLCGKCNSGLGLFLDDPDLLRTAAKYIEADLL